MATKKPGTLAVDLDNTLAEREEPFSIGSVGKPIESILERVRAQIASGRKVVIFTARAYGNDQRKIKPVREWLVKQGLGDLEVTAEKHYSIDEFWDDRARQVVDGTVVSVTPSEKQAANMVKRERIVVHHDNHCPHCDVKFYEKYHPRPSDYTAAQEGRVGDYDELCPSCDGIVDSQEPTDEQIDNTWLGSESIKVTLREQREARRQRIKLRTSSPERRKNIPSGEETKEAKNVTTHTKSLPDGRLLDILKLIELTQNTPIEDMQLNDLHGWSESPRSGFSERRLEAVDPEMPGLADTSGNMIDGRHRAVKRQRRGDTSMRVRRVSEELMNQALTTKEAKAPRFHCPENYDKVDELKGVTVWQGQNDWEAAPTWMWATSTPDQKLEGEMVWVQLKYPSGYDPGSNEQSLAKDQEARKQAEQFRKRWLRLVKAASEYLHMSNFQDVLKDPELAKFVEASGTMVSRLTEKQAAVLAPEIPRTGPAAILHRLKTLDLETMEKKARDEIASGKVTKRDRGVKILNAIQGLRRNELKPEELMITSVPVIPPAFRPFSLAGGTYIPGAANELYQDLLKHRDLDRETRQVFGDAGAPESRVNVLNAVRALYGYGEPVSKKVRDRAPKGFLDQIVGTNPKLSFVARKLLAKPQDSVGRATITVAPDLDMNQISIPRDMGWDIFGSHVQRKLVQSGMPVADAIRAVTNRSPEASQALEALLPVHPVMYSRAPAWHKFSSIGGYARLHDGNNIAINPYVTAGLNADFDGDQCLNQILACIPSVSVACWEMSYPKLQNHLVRFPAGSSSIPTFKDGQLFIFDLEDFPHSELQHTKEGKNGRIDFHHVDHPIYVLAHDPQSQQLKWAQVSTWSKHYARVIEIVDTHNGYQIITDNDPRAVYGTAAGKLDLQRFTPDAAKAASVLVPRARHVPTVAPTLASVPGCNGNTHQRSIRMLERVPLNANTGWIVGAMAGDGWVIKSRTTVKGFALADNDGFNFQKLQKVLPELLAAGESVSSHTVTSVASEPGRHGDTKSHRFTGANLGVWFRDLIGGERDEDTAGSANKHLPAFYLSAPEDFRSGLLCGLIDTDGSISISNGKSKPQLMSSFGSTSIRLVMECKLLAASLGIFGRITPSTTPLGKPCWMLTFSNRDIQHWGAPYLAHEVKRKALLSAPEIEDSPVTAKYDIVPVPAALADALAKSIGCPKIKGPERKVPSDALREKMDTQKLYMSFAQARNAKHEKYGAVSRQTALTVLSRLGWDKIKQLPQGAEWLLVVENEAVTWERVTGVQKTGIREDGYDLTVPGYETFMSADGIILSNTINVHAPALPSTIKEIKDKLMPDKMLFSIRNQDAVVPLPKHESVLGLFASQQRPSRGVHQFASRQEALAAIQKGDVSYQDEVEFPDEIKPLTL